MRVLDGTETICVPVVTTGLLDVPGTSRLGVIPGGDSLPLRVERFR